MMVHTNTSEKELVYGIVGHRLTELDSTPDHLISQWVDRTIRMLNGSIVESELDYIRNSVYERNTLKMQLLQLQSGLLSHPDFYLLQPQIMAEKPMVDVHSSQLQTNLIKVENNNVFIVHGQDELAKETLARVLEKLKLTPVILHEQASQGKTIIEKFETNALKSSFAIVLLTPDDEGGVKGKPDTIKPRARQNVILELGYFCGALGRSKVCVLYKGNVEIPSDYLGVAYIEMDDKKAWCNDLVKELRQAGLSVNANDLT